MDSGRTKRMNFSLDNIGQQISDFFGGITEPREKTISDVSEVYHLSDFLPYQWYDQESELFISEKHIGFILQTAPLVGSSEAMQKNYLTSLRKFFPRVAAYRQ